jgi:3-deoxy-D-manno-octulosonic-acid transferase/heptosyltransferase-1
MAVDARPTASERSTRSTRLRARPPNADRILIIRLGALGDVIRTVPAVAALRTLYPGAHLAWLVEPAAAGVVEVAGVVDETIVFPRRDLVESIQTLDGLALARQLSGVIRQLRRRRFDLVLDFHGILKSGLLALLSGAPIRVGYGHTESREWSHLFMNRRIELPKTKISRYDRNAALVTSLAPRVEIPERTLLHPSAMAVARLASRLRGTEREKANGFVLIHPGSSPSTPHKRYAPEAWADVAKRLAAEGIEIWLAAGPSRDERNRAEEILRLAGGDLVRAPETRSFDDLLALVSRASVFVASDSGPLHAASLVGISVVQLLGPTDPIQNEPWRGSPFRRVHVPLPCSPCRRGCEAAACMRAIPPALVVSEVKTLYLAHSTVTAQDGSESAGPSR